MDMKERIKKIMDDQRLSPSAFADKLQIGRAVISHILNGRNNASLDVIIRILSQMNTISPEWLLTGDGEMYKSDADKPLSNEPDLFFHTQGDGNKDRLNDEDLKEPVAMVDKSDGEKLQKHVVTDHPLVSYARAGSDKKISRIIIYYSDNTFEVFHTDNRPL